MTAADTDALRLVPDFQEYRRSQIANLRPYIEGETLSDRVSISAADKEAGSPKAGDMIARNPANHDDQWLVAADYFAANFEPAAPAVQPAAGREVYNAIVTLQAFLDDFDNENLDAIEADDFNIGQDEYIEVPSATLRRVLTALAHPPAQVSGGEVEGAASALLDACYTADENSDLSDFIDGTLLTRLDRALSARVLAALSAPQAAPGEGEQS